MQWYIYVKMADNNWRFADNADSERDAQMVVDFLRGYDVAEIVINKVE